jgi:hypothetical protein
MHAISGGGRRRLPQSCSPPLRSLASRQNEFNVEAEYQPMSGPFKNLHVQLLYSGDNPPPGQDNQPQVHAIVTYLVPLLKS